MRYNSDKNHVAQKCFLKNTDERHAAESSPVYFFLAFLFQLEAGQTIYIEI